MQKLQTNFNILKKSITRNWLKWVPKTSENTLSSKSKNLYQVMIFSLSGNEASHNLVRAVACGRTSGARPPIWNRCPPGATFIQYCQGRRQRGASGARPLNLKSVPHHFTFGPLVAAYIQYSIFKMWLHFWFLAPPSDFWPPCC